MFQIERLGTLRVHKTHLSESMGPVRASAHFLLLDFFERESGQNLGS